MRKFQEIIQTLKPLLKWRARRLDQQEPSSLSARGLAALQAAEQRRQALTLPRPSEHSEAEWRPTENVEVTRACFNRFREFMYSCNQKTKQTAAETPRALWEAGKLAGGRPYFFLQPWNDRGYLFEQAPRGWIVARAEKIASQAQFMRERSAWDLVIIYEVAERPGMLRVSSEQMGEGPVSLRLYEDFMSQAFRAED